MRVTSKTSSPTSTRTRPASASVAGRGARFYRRRHVTMLGPGGCMGDENRLNEHPVGGIERLNGAVVVRLIGELDLYNAPQVRAALLEVCDRSEEHTSELQSLAYLVCRLL